MKFGLKEGLHGMAVLGLLCGCLLAPLIFFASNVPVVGTALAFGLIGIFLGPTLLAVGCRLMEPAEPKNPEPGSPQ